MQTRSLTPILSLTHEWDWADFFLSLKIYLPLSPSWYSEDQRFHICKPLSAVEMEGIIAVLLDSQFRTQLNFPIFSLRPWISVSTQTLCLVVASVRGKKTKKKKKGKRLRSLQWPDNRYRSWCLFDNIYGLGAPDPQQGNTRDRKVLPWLKLVLLQ